MKPLQIQTGFPVSQSFQTDVPVSQAFGSIFSPNQTIEQRNRIWSKQKFGRYN